MTQGGYVIMMKQSRIVSLALAGLLGLPSAYAATSNTSDNATSPQPPAPVVDPEPAVAAPEHHSWGTSQCGFDTFVANHITGKVTDSVTIATIGTGVDASHPFLQGKIATGGVDLVDEDDDPNDENGHGTFLAGVIVDCCGDAPVTILPIRVLDKNGMGDTSVVARGIRFAADQGADIIDLSLGGAHTRDNAIDDAIRYAVEKGSFVVTAAGNDNNDTALYCPSHITIPGVAVVGAATSEHKRMSFSNYGVSLDLLAPGDKVEAATLNGEFGSLSGTSIAVPHVSAAVALIDLAWGKALTPAQLEEKLLTATTYQIWTNKQEGCGFLTLDNAAVPDSPDAPATDTEAAPTTETATAPTT